ncbi:hypothetical protein WJX72_006756 [[Myrmecia] bisecta]|uniref:Uncharacterized protein n=1 Tax=[Myrmecia] bisecta TaxID=41462 RepID=A0AAW1PFY2_9CHLO
MADAKPLVAARAQADGSAQAARAVSTGGVAALPSELKDELLQALAKWQLLTADALQLLWHWGQPGMLPTLSFAGCGLLSAACVAHAVCNAGHMLTSLNLRGVLQLDDRHLQEILHCCPHLTSLNLAKCTRLSDAALAAIAAAALPLLSLNLAGCWRVTHIAPLAVCTKLDSLALDGCGGTEEYCLSKVCMHATDLKNLSLRNCAYLTDGHFHCLWTSSQALACLEQLDISGCEGVGDAVLVALARRCHLLQHLAVSNCPRVTGLGVSAVLRSKAAASQLPDADSNDAPPQAANVWDTAAEPSGAADVAEIGRDCSNGDAPDATEQDRQALANTGTPGGVNQAAAAAATLGPTAEQQSMHAVRAVHAGPERRWRRRQLRDLLHLGEEPVPETVEQLLEGLGASASTLERLDLSGSLDVNDTIPVFLAQHCPNLTALNLANTSVSDEGAEALSALVKLQELNLSGCTGSRARRTPGSGFLVAGRPHKRMRLGGVSDAGIAQLVQHERLPQLRSLSLGGLAITDLCLANVCGLTRLDVRHCKRVTINGLLQALMHCHDVSVLELLDCSGLKAGGAAHAAHAAPGRQHSALQGCHPRKVSLPRSCASHAILLSLTSSVPSNLAAPTGSCNLTRLTLGNAGHLRDADVALLASRCALLCALTLWGAEQLGDAAAHSLARHCRLLAQVSLTQSRLLTDRGGCPLVTSHARSAALHTRGLDFVG